MQTIWLIFKWLRRSDWASPPDRSDANTAFGLGSNQWRPPPHSQGRALLEKGTTLSGASHTPDISRYWRQRGVAIEYGP